MKPTRQCLGPEGLVYGFMLVSQDGLGEGAEPTSSRGLGPFLKTSFPQWLC